MHHTCRQCGSPFEVTQDDLAFLEKVSPVFRGKKELIPPPTLCSDCRQQRRWAFQNQRFLYHHVSDATGKDIISAYAPEKPFTVFEKNEWLKIDNTDLGRSFDFSRPFFEQFHELYRATPKAAVLQTGEMINSDYTHFVGWQKNCYLIFDAGDCEDCLYGIFMGYCRSCVDTLDMQRNELCYDCVDLSDCYGLFHATFCRNCSSSAYLFDCIGCKHCIGCANLRNKEYYVFNKEVGKEEFEQTWQRLFDGTHAAHESFLRQWEVFLPTIPHRAVHNTNAADCTGDYLVNCENAIGCFKCFELKDAKHCQYVVLQSHDLHDVSSFGESLEFSYELSASGGQLGRTGMNNCCFDAYVYYGGSNVYYSIQCLDNCRDLFGCCDLRGKKYCILNRQYTKEEYEDLVPKIITHMRKDGGALNRSGTMHVSEGSPATGSWGEFFPVTLSPFSYNESVAQDHFPLSREEALSKGFSWREQDQKEYRPATAAVPDSITDVSDAFTKETLACTRCSKNYRFTTKELEFYRTHGLPAPRVCPDCRHLHRLSRRNPQKLWKRECMNCGKAIATSYSPERPEIVYCEECYRKEVY